MKYRVGLIPTTIFTAALVLGVSSHLPTVALASQHTEAGNLEKPGRAPISERKTRAHVRRARHPLLGIWPPMCW
jgi:hypothetical protein